MNLTNLDNRHFTNADKTAINAAISELETQLNPKLAALTAEQRQRYGSVNEQNKLIIDKVKNYYDTQPTLSSPDVDWEEFNNDHATRGFLQSTIQQLERLLNGMENAKILHDYDNYTAALTDYDYAKYKAGNNVNGFQPKVDELQQFFTGS